MFRLSCLGIWWHHIWISEKLKFDYQNKLAKMWRTSPYSVYLKNGLTQYIIVDIMKNFNLIFLYFLLDVKWHIAFYCQNRLCRKFQSPFFTHFLMAKSPFISFFQAHPTPPHFWQYFLYLSPKSNVGQTKNKLMSQSYFFIFRRLQNIATLLFY